MTEEKHPSDIFSGPISFAQAARGRPAPNSPRPSSPQSDHTVPIVRRPGRLVFKVGHRDGESAEELSESDYDTPDDAAEGLRFRRHSRSRSPVQNPNLFHPPSSSGWTPPVYPMDSPPIPPRAQQSYTANAGGFFPKRGSPKPGRPRQSGKSSSGSDRPEPKPKRPFEPRQRKKQAAVNAQDRDASARLAGRADAAREMAESDVEAKEEPKVLNPVPSASEPHGTGSRFKFAPANLQSRWPAYLFMVLPQVATISLWLGLRPFPWQSLNAFVCLLSLFVLLAGQLALLLILRNLVEQRTFMEWTGQSVMTSLHQLGLHPNDPEQVAETVHNHPDIPFSSTLLCTYVWFLACMTQFLSPVRTVVSGVSVFLFRAYEGPTTVDIRLPNQASNKCEPVAIAYDCWAVVSFSAKLLSLRVSCESMVRQYLPRLQDLSPDDRIVQAHSMANRTTNIMIRGSLYPAVCHGSADTAIDHANAADFSKSVYKSGRTFISHTTEVFSLMVSILCMSFLVVGPSIARLSTSGFLPGSIAISAYMDVVILLLVSPLFEESIKSLIAKTGVPRIWVSAVFGYIEFVIRGADITALPAFYMHLIVGFLPLGSAAFVHTFFNAFVFLAYYCPTDDFVNIFAKWWRAQDPEPKKKLPSPNTSLPDTPEYINRLCGFYRCMEMKIFGTMPASYQTEIDANKHWFSYQDYCVNTMPGSSMTTVLIICLAALLTLAAQRRNFRVAVKTAYAYGYRVGEVVLPAIPSHGATIKKLPKFFLAGLRHSACCSLGFDLANVVPPFPDFSHPPTILHGCLHRFCKNPPTPNARMLRRLSRYVKTYVESHYNPIAADDDVSLETWLAGTDYPEWRKKQLRTVWNNRPCALREDFLNKGFGKKEHYTEFKPARGINSRTDNFKCATGPYFKRMERQLYHQDCFDGEKLVSGHQSPFIKHIPVHLRPEFIRRMLGSSSGPFYETDYSQFEKHFTPRVLRSLELILYKHMLKNHPAIYILIEAALAGKNVCVYNGFILKVFGRRMSGDMCTSLGNGFSNLMLFRFVAHQKGGHAYGVVEGDDALFVSTIALTPGDFEQLGFQIKVEVFNELNQSSFCGMLSSSDGQIMRNIARVIPKFAWTFSPRRVGGPKVRLGLLRARALSLAYESPQCPILHVMAKRALDVTYGYAPIFDYSYHSLEIKHWVDHFKEDMTEKLTQGPSLTCRIEFADKFGISVACQLRIEEILATWDGSSMSHPLVEQLFWGSKNMYEFSHRFVLRGTASSTIFDPSA